jgi:hypothetical protein
MAGVYLRRALRLAALAWSGAAGAALALGACGNPYSASPEVDVPDAEAGVDAAVDAAVADPCDHAFAPAPPAIDDAPGEELPPFFLAVRTVTFTNDTKKIVGYDLDGVCTCDTHPDTAHEAGVSCASKKAGCDLARGIDNTVSLLAAQLSPFFSLDAIPQKLIEKGRRTTLLQIGKYNGRLNDKEIAFGVAVSDGIREPGCAASIPNAGKGIWTPGWCGDDHWTFLPDSLIPTTKQPLNQGIGYVTNGVLTLVLANPLQLPFDEVSTLKIGSSVMTGTLVPLGEDLKPRDRARPPTDKEKRLFSLESALVGGRARATELLTTLGTLQVGSASQDGGATYACTDPSFPLLRQELCAGVDIASTLALDFDPGAKCDALSVAMAFSAFPVLPGEVHVTPAIETPCSPGADGQPAGSGTARPYACDGVP